MGYAQILLGDVEDGSARLREAIAISPRGFERTSAWANLAEALHLVGRSQEGLAAAEQGLADTAGEGRFSDWLSLGLLDIRWALGDWEAARAALPPHDRRHIGMTLAYVETLRAAIALADAEHDLARASLERAADVIQGSREPQFLGWFGSLRGELERRCGDLVAARTAVDDGLDAIEFCSEDLPRIALLSETGAAIEADAAQRARDLGDEAAESEAIFRAEMFLARAEAAAGVEDDRRTLNRLKGSDPSDVRPVETARLATVRSHLARARGEADPALDAEAAGAWRAVARPYPVAIAQLRRAETLVGMGDRDDAAAQLADVLAAADTLGAAWLRAEAEGLAGRARLPLPTVDEAPEPEAARRGSVRADAARAAGARAGRRRRDEPRDRRAALHGREDRERARVAHPREARRAQQDRSGRRGAPLRSLSWAARPRRGPRPARTVRSPRVMPRAISA